MIPRAAIVLAAVCGAGCSSWDTGSASFDDVEHACLDTIETFARAAERCDDDYATAYDHYLRRDANGDCKNVTKIRDEPSLRATCLPSVRTLPCASLSDDILDPTCARQLIRPQ